MSKVIYEFELPNKTILEIEGEQGKQAEATAKAKNYIKENFNQAAQPEELTASERLEDAALSVGSGTYKGLSYIPGVAGDIEQLARLMIGKESGQFLPTSKQIRGYAETVVPQLKTL